MRRHLGGKSKNKPQKVVSEPTAPPTKPPKFPVRLPMVGLTGIRWGIFGEGNRQGQQGEKLSQNGKFSCCGTQNRRSLVSLAADFDHGHSFGSLSLPPAAVASFPNSPLFSSKAYSEEKRLTTNWEYARWSLSVSPLLWSFGQVPVLTLPTYCRHRTKKKVLLV